MYIFSIGVLVTLFCIGFYYGNELKIEVIDKQVLVKIIFKTLDCINGTKNWSAWTGLEK